MSIPASFIQELLNRVDVVDVIDASVPLKKAGANYIACCPFHNEKSPSFTVSPTKQFYHCFGCGAHGTAVGFLMEYQGVDFVEAIEMLAKRVGLTVPQEQRGEPRQKEQALGAQAVLGVALAYYRAELKKSERAIAYLKKRGLSGQIAARFQMGYAPPGWQNLEAAFPDYASAEALATAGLVVNGEQGRRYDRFRDRIMFPIHDQRGQVIGFGGRVLGGEGDEAGPKYLNSPETPLFQKGHELYGLFQARKAIRDSHRAVVVEGYMDVVALAQNGVEYAVATLGTATTPAHIVKLMRQTDNIVFCFDGDAAGRKAAWRAAVNSLPALSDGLTLSFCFLPPEHDPDSYVREHGKEDFEAMLDNALPLSQYIVQELCAKEDMQTQEGRVRFLNEAAPLLKQIQAPALSLMLRKRIAELAGVTLDEMGTLLHLEQPKPMSARAPGRAPRKAPTLARKLLHMLLLRPQLAQQLLPQQLPQKAPEDALLRRLLELAHAHPHMQSAALLDSLRAEAPEPLMKELSAELMSADEDFDIEQEFAGAMKQLSDAGQHQDMTALLALAQEQGLQALTPEQKMLVQQYRRPIAKNGE
ncbi:MAG: DNA primase [Nitrosomonadales bacterium]|nr:MAG: DNA primase [Nitrosomonadales bacterium]